MFSAFRRLWNSIIYLNGASVIKNKQSKKNHHFIKAEKSPIICTSGLRCVQAHIYISCTIKELILLHCCVCLYFITSTNPSFYLFFYFLPKRFHVFSTVLCCLEHPAEQFPSMLAYLILILALQSVMISEPGSLLSQKNTTLNMFQIKYLWCLWAFLLSECLALLAGRCC